ncbi:unnamed protein product, partial [Mesorhabditis belari]|uniref:Protein JTB n=1 Tax=Mesorhabditis belari TaxID=2138241 RepID=A0AAF3EV29_9BILA
MGNFFETISKKKLIPLIFALIGFSILVFVIEEYVEDNDYDGDFALKASSLTNKVDSPALPTEDCYKYEPFIVLDKCIACTDFETQAMKAKHCQQTGFFDRLNCTKSKHIVLRPCLKVGQTSSFYKFVIINGFITAIAWIFALKRREYLDTRAYHRVQQQLT